MKDFLKSEIKLGKLLSAQTNKNKTFGCEWKKKKRKKIPLLFSLKPGIRIFRFPMISVIAF